MTNQQSTNEIKHDCSTSNKEITSFCTTCKKMICDQCVKAHTNLKHIIEEPKGYALRFKEFIVQHMNSIVNDLNNKKTTLLEQQSAMESSLGNVLEKFKKDIGEILNSLIDNVRTKKEKLLEKIPGIITSLDNQAVFNEYDDELNIIINVLDHQNYTQIHLLDKKTIDRKYNEKQQHIYLLQKFMQEVKNPYNLFLAECESIKEVLLLYSKTSIEDLTQMYWERIAQIKECEMQLHDHSQKILELVESADGIYNDIATLKNAKNQLSIDVERLKSEKKQINGEIEIISENIEIRKMESQMLKCKKIDMTTEINNLDTILKIKENMTKSTISDAAVNIKENLSLDGNELMLKSSIIYIFDQIKSTINIYHFELNKALKISLNDCNILSNFGSVQIRNDLYISGGFDVDKMEFSKSTFKFSFIDIGSVGNKVLDQMLIGKSLHKLVMLDPTTIYSLGGRTSSVQFTNECEKYNIEKEVWGTAPNLNEAKVNIGATSINYSIIYTFGGSKKAYISTIECLDTINPNPAWKIIKLKNAKGWSARDEVGCVQFSETQILIFGGINGAHGSTNECCLFDTLDLSISTTSKKLKCKECFAGPNPVRLADGRICASGTFKNDIHIFDKQTTTWTIIKAKSWRNF